MASSNSKISVEKKTYKRRLKTNLKLSVTSKGSYREGAEGNWWADSFKEDERGAELGQPQRVGKKMKKKLQ